MKLPRRQWIVMTFWTNESEQLLAREWHRTWTKRGAERVSAEFTMLPASAAFSTIIVNVHDLDSFIESIDELVPA